MLTAGEDEFLKRFNLTDPSKCRSDLDAAFHELMNILKDLKGNKLITLVGSITKLAGELSQIQTGCQLIKPLKSPPNADTC